MTTPEENVRVVLRAFELWNEGDLDGWADLFDPDVLVIAPEGWPEGPPTEGFEAWKRQAQRLRETWREARADVGEVRAVGRDRVLARLRYVTRGEGTEISFDTPMTGLFTLEQGRITRGHYFWDHEEAAEAAGLSE